MLILVHFDHFKGILASREGSVGGNIIQPQSAFLEESSIFGRPQIFQRVIFGQKARPKMGQKWDPNVAHLPLPKRPFSGYRPLGAFWSVLVDFGLPFGTPLVPFGSIWGPFGSMLGPFGSIWGPFGSISHPFCFILDPDGPFWTLWAEFQTVLAFFSSKLGSFYPFSVFWRLNLQKHLAIYPEFPNFLQFFAGKLSSPGPGAELLPQATEIQFSL